MNLKLRKRLRRFTAVCLSLCLCAAGPVTSAADEAVASSMKLTATEGTVKLENKNGKGISVIQGMKLYSGYRIGTEAASYAYISLDAAKAVKLDAVSRAEIRQKGKQLEVLLEAGNLFFNVSSPLKADETLNIRTSTMVTGIRGTCGWVKKIDENVSRLYILEGKVLCSVTNPVTGKAEAVEIGAGQTVTFTVGADGSVTAEIGTYTEAQVDGFVASAIRDDPVLQHTLTQGGIFDVPLIIGRADETLAGDQLLIGQQLADLAAKLSGQSAGKDVSEVFRDSSGSRSDSGGSSGSDNSSSADPAREMVRRTMPISAAELNALLKTNDVTLAAQTGADILVIDSGVTVPAGGILNIGTGITTEVRAGQTLQVDGSLTADGEVHNRGTINNTSVNTFRAQAGLTNSGSFTNTGRLIAEQDLNNTGTFVNRNMLEAKTRISHAGGTMELGGTVTGDVDSESDLTLSGTVTGLVTSRGETNMTGGTVRKISLMSQMLTIDGGTVENGVTLGDAGHLILNNGTVNRGNSEAAILHKGGLGTENLKVELNGGTVDGEDGAAISLSAGILKLDNTVVKATDAANLIRGGNILFSYQGSTLDIDSPQSSVANNGKYRLAGVGTDLTAMLTEAQGGEVIVMRKAENLGSAESLIAVTAPLSAPVTVEMNGNALTLAETQRLSVGEDGIEGGLIIKNSKNSGTMQMKANSSLYVGSRGKLKLDGVSLEIGETQGGSSIQNSGGTLTVVRSNLSSRFTAAATYPLIELQEGKTAFTDSTITGGTTLGSPVISASVSGGGGILTLAGTEITAEGTGPVIELFEGMELTIGDQTEIAGQPSEGGVLFLRDDGSTIHFDGGLIRNESPSTPVIQWDAVSVEFPAPYMLKTVIQGRGVLLSLQERSWIPDGYTVELNESTGYNEFKKAADRMNQRSFLRELVIPPGGEDEASGGEKSEEAEDKKNGMSTPSDATPSDAQPSGTASSGAGRKDVTIQGKRKEAALLKAGNETAGSTEAKSAMNVICAPAGIAVDADGSLLVTDTYHKVVWRVSGGAGAVYAGAEGVKDLYGEPVGGYYDGTLSQALFKEPWGIAPFLDGYAVSDPQNQAVRLVNAAGVKTAVGSGTAGFANGKGIRASFNRPTGLASDGAGNLYIADTNNGCIRKVTQSGMVMTYVEGLSEPTGLCYKNGALYVAESGGNRILKVTGGAVSVLAGSGEAGMADGEAGQAQFLTPQGVTVDDAGAVYVSDTGNRAVRKVENGAVTTVMAGDPGALNSYPVSPMGLIVQGNTLFVCDNFSRMVLAVSLK